MESLLSEMFASQRSAEQGSFKVQSYNSHPLNPSAPEFTVGSSAGSAFQQPSFFTPPSMVTPPTISSQDSSGLGLLGIFPSAPRSPQAPTSSNNTPDWFSAEQVYDALEEQFRREFSSRCVQRNEHMIAVFNLDPKTSKKELTDIFFPTGATDSIIFDLKGASILRRKYGVVFFPHKDFALHAVGKINHFAPQRQTQLLVVRYCGPDAPLKNPVSNSEVCTITDNDLSLIVNLLNESNFLNTPTSDHGFASVHALELSTIDNVLKFAQEKALGVVVCNNWCPPPSYGQQSSVSKLNNTSIRTAVIRFPTRSIASNFIVEVEQKAKSANIVLRAVLLGKESKNMDSCTSAPGSFPVDSVSSHPFSSSTSAFPCLTHPFGGKGNLTASLPMVSQHLSQQNLNCFVDPTSTEVPGSLSAFGVVDPAESTTVSTPTLAELINEISLVAQRALKVNSIEPVLHKLICHPEFSQQTASDVSQLLGQIVRDPLLAEPLGSSLCEMMISTSNMALSDSPLENNNLWFRSVGTDMLNLVVYKGFLPEVSRKVAGEVSVYCFFHGYLPFTPPRFAVVALNRFEKTLQSERQDAEAAAMSESSTVVSIVRVLKHMIDMWGVIVPINDPDVREFATKMKEVLELCESVSDMKQRGEGKRTTAQLTPSARPTPRRLVVMTSPSSGSSNRRDGFHMPGAGAPPQVKLSVLDPVNGVSSDGSTETSLLAMNSSQKHPSQEHPDGVKREDRIECTLFVSSVPTKFTHPQIRRLLLHFGEINKVRVKAKGKRGSAKASATVNVFVEFCTKEEANAMIEYFANVSDRDFDFLRTASRSRADHFDESDIQLLYGSGAVLARNEIRGPHHSDAVYRMFAEQSPGEEGVTGLKWIRVSPCTFGVEDSIPDVSGVTVPLSDITHQSDQTGETFNSLLSDLQGDHVPSMDQPFTSKKKERFLSEDDMDDLLNEYIKNAYEDKGEDVNLDFNTVVQTSSPFAKHDAEQYANLSVSFSFEGA